MTVETAATKRRIDPNTPTRHYYLQARLRSGGLALAAYVVTGVIAAPLLWVFILSLQPQDRILSNSVSLTHLSLNSYGRALQSLPIIRMYANTILIALVSVSAGCLISFALSIGLVLMVFRHPRVQSGLRSFVLLGLAVPIYILLFPVYKTDVWLGIYGSYWALIVPYAAIAIPFNTLLFTGFLRSFPRELEEAAIVDGAGLRTLLRHILIPLMRPILATVLIFNTIYVFNEFPFASILIADRSMSTVALAVSQFQGQYSVDYGAMMAATTMILLPQVVVYFVFQKQVIAGMTVGAVKG